MTKPKEVVRTLALDPNMSGSASEALKKLVLGHIKDAGTGGFPNRI
jgi:hypothetical protein